MDGTRIERKQSVKSAPVPAPAERETRRTPMSTTNSVLVMPPTVGHGLLVRLDPVVDGLETDAAAGTEQQGTAPDTPPADESGPRCRPVLAVRPLGPRDVVRPPRESADGWEGVLAVANADAARRAERHVAAVFPEWGRFALSGAAAAPGRWRSTRPRWRRSTSPGWPTSC